MTIEEYLAFDRAYTKKSDSLIANIASAMLFKRYSNDANNGTIGNQRDSFEDGFKRGIDFCKKDMEYNGTNPNCVGLTKSEYMDYINIMDMLGITFNYICGPDSIKRDVLIRNGMNPDDMNGLRPGLNLCKNENENTLSAEDRKEIMDLMLRKIQMKKMKNISIK